ncbi:MAG: 6-bladed beta-propeller [Nitrospirota bacterium]
MSKQKQVKVKAEVEKKLKIHFLSKIFFIFSFSLTLACLSCAPPAVKEVKLIWPSPPEEPKLAYVNSYKGESDFKKKGFFEAVLGETMFSTDLQKPYGVTAYGDKMYVTDTQSAVVFVFDLKEQKVTFMGYKDLGKLALPAGVAVSSDGIIFVSDAKQKRVFGYDANGNLKIALGKKDEFKNPGGIAINNDIGRLYIIDSYGHMVHVYSTKGDPLFTFGKRGDGDGEFNYPSNVAIERKTGNIYIVDTQNFRVQVFDKDGKFVKRFGQIGDVPGTFTRPKGIGIDSEGHIYVADAAFDNLQIFDDKGQILLFIGGPGHEPGYFWLPAGVYVDEKDRIYIVDSFNHRVQVLQYLSEKWKKENPEKYKEYLMK